MIPKLSIVTGTLNRPASFQRLIDSIVAVTQVPFEVVVSDASDTPDSLCIRDLPENVQIYPERPRLGMTGGYNRAFRAAKGDWCLWLNDDVEVLRGYDTEAIAFMEAHPKIGLGALYYREGHKDFHVNSYYQMIYANFGIFRREFGVSIDFFDPTIPMYGCDNAFAFKVLLAGKGIAGIPNARIIHHAADDQLRRDNNESDKRIRDAELLRDTYGSRLAEMQRVYAETSIEGTAANDQTPSWMWPKVTA